MLEVTKAINLILFNFFCTINIYKVEWGVRGDAVVSILSAAGDFVNP